MYDLLLSGVLWLVVSFDSVDLMSPKPYICDHKLHIMPDSSVQCVLCGYVSEYVKVAPHDPDAARKRNIRIYGTGSARKARALQDEGDYS